MLAHPRSARQRPAVAGLLCGVAATLSALGASPAQAKGDGYNPAGLDAPTLERVRAVCIQVMRLDPNEAHFGGCVESLSSAAAGRSRGRALALARGRCLTLGLAPDTAGLAQCELEGANRAAAEPAVEGPEPRSASSYETASNAEIFRREQLSCARMGLEPAGPAFGGCVRDLQAAMLAVDIPSQ